MRRRSSSSVRIFYPRLSSEEVIGLLRERLPKVAEELPFLKAVLFDSYNPQGDLEWRSRRGSKPTQTS